MNDLTFLLRRIDQTTPPGSDSDRLEDMATVVLAGFMVALVTIALL